VFWLKKISFACSKIKLFTQFYDICSYKKMVGQKNFTPPLLVLLLDPGSEIRKPRWMIIRIRDEHPGSATLPSVLLYGIDEILY
jgi:hypothetical protein